MAVACDAQSLVDLTPPLNGIPLGLIPYAQLALLCAIAKSMDCTPATLLDNAKCLECSIPPGLVQYASLALLCSINAGGGGGGSSVFSTGVGSPEGVVTGSPGDRYQDTGTGTFYTKVTGAATTTGWFVG